MPRLGSLIRLTALIAIIVALALLTKPLKAQYPAQVIAFGYGTPQPGYRTCCVQLTSQQQNLVRQLVYWLNGDPYHGVAIEVNVSQVPWILTSVTIYGSYYQLDCSGAPPPRFTLEIWNNNRWTLYSATYDPSSLFPDSHYIGHWATITMPGILINTTTFYIVIYPNMSNYNEIWGFCGFQPFIYFNSSGVIYLVTRPGNGIYSSVPGTYLAVIVTGVPSSVYFGKPVQPIYVGGIYKAVEALSYNVTILSSKVNILSNITNSIIKSMNASMGIMKYKVDTMSKDVETVSSQVSALNSMLNTLNSRVDSLSSDVGALKNVVNSMSFWVTYVIPFLLLATLVISIVALLRRSR